MNAFSMHMKNIPEALNYIKTFTKLRCLAVKVSLFPIMTFYVLKHQILLTKFALGQNNALLNFLINWGILKAN